MIKTENTKKHNPSSSIEPAIGLRPHEMAKLKYRGALIAELGSIQPDYMVTLTFRRKIKRDLFDKIIKDFTFRMHNSIYGTKSKKAVTAYILCEYKTSTNLHLHMLIKNPIWSMSAAKIEEHNALKNPRFLAETVRRCWIEAGEQYGRITGDPKQHSPHSKWFATVEDPFMAADYCTKEVKYGNEDLVQWMYSTPNGLRPSKIRSSVTH